MTPSTETCVTLTDVTLTRRIRDENAYDLKRSVFALLRGSYRAPQVRHVLRKISLSLMAGERIGIIGPNGSGKSTLLKVISGILVPSSGTIAATGIIAPLIELGAGFDPELSVEDNVVLYGALLGFSPKRMEYRAGEIIAFAELEAYRGAPLRTLSSGMVARLGFAIATDVGPDILLLDEVLAVGDEHFRHKSQERLESLWRAGATVVVVSHDLSFIEKACERVVCMQKGRISFLGPARLAVRFYLDAVRTEESILP